MAQTPVQFLISFEILAETVRSLALDDQLRLQALLNQEIDRRRAQPSLEDALRERNVQFPLKTGLLESVEPIKSNRSDSSVNHDQVIAQRFWVES